MFVITCNNEKLRQGRVILPELFLPLLVLVKSDCSYFGQVT